MRVSRMKALISSSKLFWTRPFPSYFSAAKCISYSLWPFVLECPAKYTDICRSHGHIAVLDKGKNTVEPILFYLQQFLRNILSISSERVSAAKLRKELFFCFGFLYWKRVVCLKNVVEFLKFIFLTPQNVKSTYTV